ncbi:MAG TPA: hypothetical protein VK190_10165, partial [Pseudoneobacillus sp.]|nr:hypothetical protein [Pseudoneobacillus sp.]
KVWQRMYVTDFYNVDDVIDFLSKLQPFTENRFVNNLPYHHLLQVLHQHGYVKDAFTGAEFDANDRHKFAHYLVGQAIAGLTGYFGGINCTFVAHAKDYKAKFQIH